MSVPCEVAVKCVLPVVRAMVAKELMTVDGLRQVDVAKLLRVSQPAISLYGRNMRGRAIDFENDEHIKRLVSDMAKALAAGNLSRRDLILRYCGICKVIRAKGLLCKLHKAFDSTIDVENCELCTLTDESTMCF
jgi:predicted transcriptional regulator